MKIVVDKEPVDKELDKKGQELMANYADKKLRGKLAKFIDPADLTFDQDKKTFYYSTPLKHEPAITTNNNKEDWTSIFKKDFLDKKFDRPDAELKAIEYFTDFFQKEINLAVNKKLAGIEREIDKRIMPHSMYAESPGQSLNQSWRNQVLMEVKEIINQLKDKV